MTELHLALMIYVVTPVLKDLPELKVYRALLDLKEYKVQLVHRVFRV